tara:strand:+ start:162 stop:881 length:720 start_codon:yes stop_codon:yes gene_type:complete
MTSRLENPLLGVNESGSSLDALQKMHNSILEGSLWAVALLEAIGNWSLPSEQFENLNIHYFLAGEAFDWLLLAERLVREIPENYISEADKDALLFQGRLPSYITSTDFKMALGTEKYRAHLNFFYGVVLEEMLWYATNSEIEKARTVKGLQHSIGIDDEVSYRLYRSSMKALAGSFQKENGRGRSMKFSFSQYQEFVYWLFKKRISISDNARSASDTKKSLNALQELVLEKTGSEFIFY